MVQRAVSTIDGCDFAGLFLVDGSIVTTPVYTDPIVKEADAFQLLTGEGPCLDAITQGFMFYGADLGNDPRWTHFSPLAIATGIRSVLALPLAVNSQRGALNLYARHPAAFAVMDQTKASILVSLASVALSVAHTHEDEERRMVNLQSALASREIIGEAVGILMERQGFTVEQAFDVLRRASWHLNIKVQEVAQKLVETGEDPDG